MVLSLRAMMMQFVILMMIAAFCFCGFLYALWTSVILVHVGNILIDFPKIESKRSWVRGFLACGIWIDLNMFAQIYCRVTKSSP